MRGNVASGYSEETTLAWIIGLRIDRGSDNWRFVIRIDGHGRWHMVDFAVKNMMRHEREWTAKRTDPYNKIGCIREQRISAMRETAVLDANLWARILRLLHFS